MEEEKRRAAEWRKNNNERANEINATRRAARHKAIPKWFDEFDEFVVSECAALASIRTRQTGIAWHVDHMVPLQAKKASGLHCADNLQVIPAVMNSGKRNKLIYIEPYEWIKAISSATQ